MRNLLRASVLLALILLLIPSASGQEIGYPACSESEILTLISSMLDYITLRQPTVETVDDLARHASLHIESRDSSFSLLPLCSTAIVTQRQVIALYGDFAGGSALDRAGVPRSANPYFARDLVDEGRIGRALEDLMAAAGEGDAPQERSSIRFCSRAENDLLNELAEEFLSFDLGAGTAGNRTAIVFIDLILAWRDEKMALLPECAQAIEFGFLLSKATTDAAALLAFRYAGVPEAENSYVLPAGQARDSLSTWRKDLMIIQPQYKDATVLALGPASELPPCNAIGVRYAHDVLVSKVMDVVHLGQSAETADDLLAYEQAHIDLRDGSLARLPLCAELFEINWLLRQVIADGAAWAASKVLGYDVNSNPFSQQVTDTAQKVLAWLENAEAFLEDNDEIVAPKPGEQEVPACRSGEILRMIGYVTPNFRAFVNAGREMESGKELYALFDHSFALRDQLWQDLPRCQKALEIGLVMQQVAGDWIAMLTLDIAGADSGDFVPYLAQIKSGMARFEELKAGLSQDSPSVGKIYHVTADPYANIRSCAATSCSIVTTAQNGEALTVVDDFGDWYELRLDDGRTGYIAGFLMSETRP